MDYIINECGEFPSLGDSYSTTHVNEAVRIWKKFMETNPAYIPEVCIDIEEIMVPIVCGGQFDFEMLEYVDKSDELLLAVSELVKEFMKAGVKLTPEQESFVRIGEEIMKMDYEEFKEKVISALKDYLPEEYEVKVVKLNKINQSLDGLSVIKKGANMGPTFYIENMYESYLGIGDFNTVLKSTVRSIEAAMKGMNVNIKDILNPDYAQDRIVLQLVNTRQNEKMLSNLPHREFLDLSVIYRIVIDSEPEIVSSVINNECAREIGLTEAQLFRAAIRNTKRIFPLVIKHMYELLMEMQNEIQVPLGEDIGMPEVAPEFPIFVISNDKHCWGASALLYEEALYELSEKIGSDLYVIPSSIHELIVFCADYVAQPEDIASFVAEINKEAVPINERLSNQVYRYDRNLRKVVLATDTPDKRLD